MFKLKRFMLKVFVALVITLLVVVTMPLLIVVGVLMIIGKLSDTYNKLENKGG
mgnify:CR=1 FL=1|tara:strand:- start:24 stop:182 length:159 start_codon:yes stop_codon:yes gene_type:complete